MQFVTLIRFTQKGLGAIRQTAERAKTFRDWAGGAGLKIQELLWTQGSCDGLILFEAADAETAAAAMLRLASQGNVQTETLVAWDAAGMERVLGKWGG
jgi:uncharacterized protein with GYD domain